MAHNNPDLFDSQPESSGYSNDDFEKLDAPANGFEDQIEEDVTAAGAYDEPQYGEISTTTDNAGEEEAEEDRYAIGASEAEALAPHSSEPLISWGDEDEPPQVQPSAPVPEFSDEPLIDFSSSAGPDLHSYTPSAPPSSSKLPEPMLMSSKTPPSHPDEFNETESETERKQDSEQTPEATKGSWLKGVDPRVVDLIYWRDVKKTGVVFGSMLVVLLSLAICSLLSVVAYLSLAVLTVTFSFTIYKKVMGAVQKSTEGHPFKQLLEMDISLNEEKLRSVIQNFLKNVNCTVTELRRLFLIEDIVDSVKFGLLLWVLTYIGSWFNGMTLIILAVITLFTLPKVYETYQVQIDNYIGLAKAQIDNVLNIVQSKLPFLKKKEKSQ